MIKLYLPEYITKDDIENQVDALESTLIQYQQYNKKRNVCYLCNTADAIAHKRDSGRMCDACPWKWIVKSTCIGWFKRMYLTTFNYEKNVWSNPGKKFRNYRIKQIQAWIRLLRKELKNGK